MYIVYTCNRGCCTCLYVCLRKKNKLSDREQDTMFIYRSLYIYIYFRKSFWQRRRWGSRGEPIHLGLALKSTALLNVPGLHAVCNLDRVINCCCASKTVQTQLLGISSRVCPCQWWFSQATDGYIAYSCWKIFTGRLPMLPQRWQPPGPRSSSSLVGCCYLRDMSFSMFLYLSSDSERVYIIHNVYTLYTHTYLSRIE